jgi:ParB-like chromosome segregation protein Spo0J
MNYIQLLESLSTELSLDERIETINKLKLYLHEQSPFKNEPVDCVIWVKNDDVHANDYNPNSVAPPEMELLEVSIMNDGYTQPIVTFWNNGYEIIDWFHRSRVGKESKIVKQRVFWYVPIVNIRKEQEWKNDRIASTIRHNRARGKHQIDAMSEIVLELKNRNWANSRIARELGMDEDEILRLCQITWLEEMFKDNDFSREWNADDIQDWYIVLTDDVNEEELEKYRIANVEDEDRIFHTFDKWECNKAWFYASKVDWKTQAECEQEYYNVLSNPDLFWNILISIINEWKNSCEHYLTNKAMNRIAWLWQAAVCYHTWVPSKYCTWWNLLNKEQQDNANKVALKYLNIWMKNYSKPELTMDEAISVGRQVEIY